LIECGFVLGISFCFDGPIAALIQDFVPSKINEWK